ncbi:MAG: glycosyltransferase family 39 protein, partial [Acidimicrobiia bacterium]
MQVETSSRARPDTVSVPASRRAPRWWWFDTALLGVAAALLRLPALLAPRELTYDDAVYGSIALAMRQGFLPYRDILSSQGPLFFPLVFIADLIGLRTLNAPRLLSVAAGIVLTLAVYAIVRRTTGRTAAIVTALVVTISGSVLRTTAGLTGDGPAMALAVTAVALALRYCEQPTRGRAAAVGVAAGAGLAMKLIIAPVAVPLVILLLWRRRPKDIVLSGSIALAMPVLLALPWGASRVWEQSVVFHADAERQRDYGFNWEALRLTLWYRDRLVLAVVAISVIALIVLLIRRKPMFAPNIDDPGTPPKLLLATAYFGWIAVLFAELMLEAWQFSNHMAHLVPPLALLAALWSAPALVVAAAALLILPGEYQYIRPMVWPNTYGEQRTAAMDALDDLPENAWVVTDAPELVWRSGHVIPP